MQYDENLKKIQSDANAILLICKKMEQIDDITRVENFTALTFELERHILNSYVLSKNLLPYGILMKGQSAYTIPEKILGDSAKLLLLSEDKIELMLPMLMHKSNANKLSQDIIHSLFQRVISEGKQIPQMLKHTITFTFVYPKDTPLQLIRDHDNYNVKGVINAIVLYVGSSDSGLNSWHQYQTILTDARPMGTYITIERRTKK